MTNSNAKQDRYSTEDREILTEFTSRWSFLARSGQIPPDTADWFCYLMRSGRGAGKTRSGSEWVLQRVRQGYKYIGLIGQTVADVRDTMVEVGESSILKIARPDEMPIYEPSKRRLVFPNGAVATTFSGDKPDQLRGPQFDSVWIDELAKFQYPEETWDNMEFALRLGDRPQVFVTTTPRPIPIIKALLKDPQTIDVRSSTFDNIDNLSSRFLKRIKEKYEGTRLGRQELEGEMLDDNPNALWRRDIIENLRLSHHPVLIRVVTGVDPAVTSGENSADTGIITVGKDAAGHYYVLEDNTIHGTPFEWGSEVVKAYNRNEGDLVVGETNNGGDLVEENIKHIKKGIPFTKVHASRGKIIRAEPISTMYELGLVHHVGVFPELEDQMCTWQPGEKSPDRLDAAVWALWELGGKEYATDTGMISKNPFAGKYAGDGFGDYRRNRYR